MGKKMIVVIQDGEVVSFKNAHGFMDPDDCSTILQVTSDADTQILGCFYNWEYWMIAEE